MKPKSNLWSKLGLFVVLFLCLNVSSSFASETITWSFETQEGIDKWGSQYQARVEQVKEHATDGEYSARVVFPTKDYPGIFVYPEKTNWANYVYFSLDVYNPDKKARGLAVQLFDINGENLVFHLNIQGKSLLSFKKRIASITRTKPNFDLEKVKKLTIFIKGSGDKERIFYLDNIRLEPISETLFKLPQISDFETKEDMEKWGQYSTVLEQSEEFVTHGDLGAKITFLSRENPWPRVQCFLENGSSSTDWSAYGKFAFDIYNPNQEAFNFAMSFMNFAPGDPGYKTNPCFGGVKPGEKRTVEFPISSIAKGIDIKSVDSFTLHIGKREKDVSIYIDNLRLTPPSQETLGAEATPSKPEPAALKPRKVSLPSGYKPNPFPEISDFEREEEIAVWESHSYDVFIEQSTKHASQGTYNAKVTFLSTGGAWPTFRIKYPGYASKDWSKYEKVAIDIYNPNKKRFRGSLTFQNSKRKTRPGYSGFGASAGGRTTIEVPLHVGMGQLSDKAPFSFSDIASLSLTISRPKEDTTVFIDNIRLVPPLILPEYVEKEFPPLSLKDFAHFRGLRILFLNWVGTDKEKVSEFYGTLNVIRENQLDYSLDFPSSFEKLKEYDVVVFDDVSSARFTPEQLKWVKRFWEEGGGIVMLGGWASFAGHDTDTHLGYKGTAVEGILPVKLGGVPDDGLYPIFTVKNSDHPVMKNIPWGRIKLTGYNKVEVKPESQVLAADFKSGTPLIVAGERTLCFMGTEHKLGGANLYNWQAWERVITQVFNYVTKDKSVERVVCAGVETPSVSGIGTELKGKVHLANLSSRKKTILVKMKLSPASLEKELGPFSLPAQQIKSLEFSIQLSSSLSKGEYQLTVTVEEKEKTIDTFSHAVTLKSSLYAENILPSPVFDVGEEVCLKTKVRNLNPEKEKITVKVNIERGGKVVTELIKKDISVGKEGGEIIEKKWLVDIPEGKYSLNSSLYKNNKVMDESKDEIRIVSPYVPVTEKDVNYFIDWQFSTGDDILRYEDLGFFKLGRGPAEVQGSVVVYGRAGGGGITGKEKFISYLQDLHDLRIPFITSLFNGWEAGVEKYDTRVEKCREVIELAEKIGKEYFAGVWVSEVDGILVPFNVVQEKEKRIDKANAYIKFMKKFREDLQLPPGKLFLTTWGSGSIRYDLDYEFGADVVCQEVLFLISNHELVFSNLRGNSRSFEKWWGIDCSRYCWYGFEPPFPFKYNPKTGRYDPDNKTPFKTDIAWWGVEPVHKVFIDAYYNGVKFIRGQSEHPLGNEEIREPILNFMKFVKDNPRCEDIISRLAVVRSKGDYWRIPMRHFSPPSFGDIESGMSKWRIAGLPLKEEADFAYLKLFFPNFSNQGDASRDEVISTSSFWTGTPYGAVDIIYPSMKLENMRKYHSIIFLGYNRMDSVRGDFFDDLMKYVKDGGVVLLSVDQLKDSQDKLGAGKVKGFLGAELIATSSTKIREYIEIRGGTPFALTRQRYPIANELEIYQEKEPRVYKVVPRGAKVIAADKEGIPVLLLNKHGKGYVFLFTTPTMSMIPPAGKSPFVSDIIDKVCRYKPLPISISPSRDDVEFLISKTGDKETAIFIMNHGEKDWSGDVILNLKAAGLSADIANNVKAKICTGYDVKKIVPRIKQDKDNLIIYGITLSGDKKDFCSYRQASFAYIRLDERK